jgi:DNA polymerase-3 subunit epsilon
LNKADGRKKEITSFSSLAEGKTALFRITEKYDLCQKINSLYETKSSCFQYEIKQCLGACINKELAVNYNLRVQEFLTKNTFERQNMVIIERGRSIEEKCAILIENGIYKGFCFYDLNYQINQIDILKTLIIPMQHNRDVKNILQSYLRKTKHLKVIHF